MKTSGREVDRLQSAVTSRSKQWSAHKAATIAAGEKIERWAGMEAWRDNHLEISLLFFSRDVHR